MSSSPMFGRAPPPSFGPPASSSDIYDGEGGNFGGPARNGSIAYRDRYSGGSSTMMGGSYRGTGGSRQNYGDRGGSQRKGSYNAAATTSEASTRSYNNDSHSSREYNDGGGGTSGAAGHRSYGGGSTTSGNSSSYYNSSSPSAAPASSGPYGRYEGGGFGSRYGGFGRGGDHQGATTKWGSSNANPSTILPQSFEKNLYEEADAVARMTPSQVAAVREKHKIRIVQGGPVPNPIVEFSQAKFPGPVLQAIERAGHSQPTPIQIQGWPIALSGRDFIGIAETGSGKTLAFLLPAIVHILAQPGLKPGEGPICLILAPTRELVEQIRQHAETFASTVGVRTGVAYGGVPRREQHIALQRGVEILLACPGRLIDFLERGNTNLNRVTFLVLDEGDRMLDMGFEPQIRTITSQIRPNRQTLFFSATWPKEVQALARDLCREDPVHITIGSPELKACHNVEQHVELISEEDKRKRLLDLLRAVVGCTGVKQPTGNNSGASRILIFVETKRGADHLTKELRLNGWPALCIHGDKEQPERLWVLNEFKQGTHPIMIATDVASRGLDIKDVKIVVNYDMPNQIEDYVHRIGRTGRAGAKGKSYTFFTMDKVRMARDLMNILREANQTIPPDLARAEMDNACNKGGSMMGGPIRRGGGAGRFTSSSNAVPIRY